MLREEYECVENNLVRKAYYGRGASKNRSIHVVLRCDTIRPTSRVLAYPRNDVHLRLPGQRPVGKLPARIILISPLLLSHRHVQMFDPFVISNARNRSWPIRKIRCAASPQSRFSGLARLPPFRLLTLDKNPPLLLSPFIPPVPSFVTLLSSNPPASSRLGLLKALSLVPLPSARFLSSAIWMTAPFFSYASSLSLKKGLLFSLASRIPPALSGCSSCGFVGLMVRSYDTPGSSPLARYLRFDWRC